MKKLQHAVMALLAVSVVWSQSTLAQEQAVKSNPAEFFACNWQKGKDMQDLQKVGEAFAEWSTANDGNYSAWILTPQLHSSDLGFEVGWLGAWPDNNAFGKGQDAWQTGGRELAADFAKVVDCSISHEMASVVPLNAPDGPPADGVVVFTPCTVSEGKTLADSHAFHTKMAAASKAEVASYLFYPGMGSGNLPFDYWLVFATQNYTQLGAAMEMYSNGGGYQKAQAASAGITSCGASTVFDATVVLQGQAS
ncbi:MAG: hypothetical protein V7754_20595 [Halioglobus sp.]